MTKVEDIAEFVCNLDVEEVNQDVLKDHILDTVSAIIAGHSSVEGIAAREVFALHGQRSLLSDVTSRCAATRSTEIDDINMRSCTTPGSVIFTTAFSLAISDGRIGERETASSIIAGYELMARLGAALDGPKIVYGGLWPTQLTAGFAVAGTFSKIYSLDKRKTSHALAIALALPMGPIPRVRTRTPSRWLTLGIASQNGVISAMGAKAGSEGDLSLLETESWLKRTRMLEIRPDILLKDLQRPLVLSQTSIKPYCIAKQATAGLECFERLVERGLDPENVNLITVAIPEYYKEMISHKPQPDERLSSISSLAYRISLSAFDHNELYNVDHLASKDSKTQIDLASKVSFEADPSLNSLYPDSYPARVEVETKGGGTLSEEVINARGDPKNPLSREDIETKFKLVTKGKISAENANEFISRVRNSSIEETIKVTKRFLSERIWTAR